MNPAHERCFGCDPEEFVKDVEASVTFQVSGIGMVLMSMLSDAQEELAHGQADKARKTMNRVKYLIDSHPSCRALRAKEPQR